MIPSPSLLERNRKKLPKNDFQRFIEAAKAANRRRDQSFSAAEESLFFNYGKNIGNNNVEIPVDEGRAADYIIAL